MNEQYAHSFSVLGLQPGSSWIEIRDAYKHLIKTWHPDRFQQDSKSWQIAEEKSMEITRAYKTLADYYRKHGSTPAKSTVDHAARTAPPETKAPPDHAGHAAPADAAETINRARHATPIPVQTTPWRTVAVLTVIVLLLYFWFLDDPVYKDFEAGTNAKTATQNVPQKETGDKTTSHTADKFFTIGSKLGEVYAIQGIPSKTEEGTWHYGKSRVYFINGSVTRWESHPENPLRASLEIEPVVAEKDYIQLGSTKTEVRTLLGTPWRQTEREWTYGSSRIFFNDDVVTGWKEHHLNPLKVRRQD